MLRGRGRFSFFPSLCASQSQVFRTYSFSLLALAPSNTHLLPAFFWACQLYHSAVFFFLSFACISPAQRVSHLAHSDLRARPLKVLPIRSYIEAVATPQPRHPTKTGRRGCEFPFHLTSPIFDLSRALVQGPGESPAMART